MSLSYWEKSTLSAYDLIVVGGGIVGMSTALHYQLKHPTASVAIVERGLFPSGASTKNAGFACFGSISELSEDLESTSVDDLLALIESRYKGALQLRRLLGDAAIGYKPEGGFELDFGGQTHEQIERFNELLKPLFNADVFSNVTPALNDFGFRSGKVKGLIKNSFEGSVDTGKMIRAFQRKCAQSGVHFFTQTIVLDYDDLEGSAKLNVQVGTEVITLTAQQIAFCTNAFTKALLPGVDLQPGRGMVLVTKPVEDLSLEGTFHYHGGYHYFRGVGNRLLLGGGRQLDLQGEATTEQGINAAIFEQLQHDIHDFIAPGKGLEIDYAWSGVMAFGANKKPIIQKVSPRISVAARLGGMGVAIGTRVGAELAELLEGLEGA